ncbi:hypothetical protein CEXT_336281 [Caerostris extrusa]|uniref:Uncharacterized protein n=1 Tax=Caerostris extrusa TaxID=172846 RepID=A0AAV4UYY3_CAEEX|nr:hypothetical protein CEXT_336281 [Caerostris extrusa]
MRRSIDFGACDRLASIVRLPNGNFSREKRQIPVRSSNHNAASKPEVNNVFILPDPGRILLPKTGEDSTELCFRSSYLPEKYGRKPSSDALERCSVEKFYSLTTVNNLDWYGNPTSPCVHLYCPRASVVYRVPSSSMVDVGR